MNELWHFDIYAYDLVGHTCGSLKLFASSVHPALLLRNERLLFDIDDSGILAYNPIVVEGLF